MRRLWWNCDASTRRRSRTIGGTEPRRAPRAPPTPCAETQTSNRRIRRYHRTIELLECGRGVATLRPPFAIDGETIAKPYTVSCTNPALVTRTPAPRILTRNSRYGACVPSDGLGAAGAVVVVAVCSSLGRFEGGTI